MYKAELNEIMGVNEMIIETTILVAIYAVWIIILVNSMVSSEEISLTIATLPFIITFPITLLLTAILEPQLPGVFTINFAIILVVGILLFVRWIMAIAGE